MKCEDNSLWGAKIERGEILFKQDDLYDVRSIDRPGVIGYGLPMLTGSCAMGDHVYFFLFEDGKGMILKPFD